MRFGAASATYGIGLLILGICAALGKLEWSRWLAIAAGFLVINLGFLLVFVSRVNLRFNDPSLTLAQVLTASSAVPPILLAGPQLDPVAVPFYSVLFVFAMLRLDRGGLIKVGVYILLTYAATVALRLHWYAGSISPSDEALTALLVVTSTFWFASAAGYISRLRSRLKETAAQLEQLAISDNLTGLWNRRHIEALLSRAAERAGHTGRPLVILLADLDRFKDINDRFGHAAGDDVLRQVSSIMTATLPAGTDIGRWGGEEFLIVLPDTPWDEAEACAQRLCEKLASAELDLQERLAVTVSVGMAAWSRGESPAALLSRADRAMYVAKASGRNRVGALDRDGERAPPGRWRAQGRGQPA